MSDDPNVLEPAAWDADLSETPFRAKLLRAGAHAGARELGATLYDLEPGGSVSPYHLHHSNEELLVVLAGRPALRTPEGTRTLEPGALVAFRRGEEGAHRVTNPGEDPARVLLISTMNLPDVAEHVDTGATLVITGYAEGKVFPNGTDIPFVDAIMRAMKAGDEAAS